jgi:hypothetical protein
MADTPPSAPKEPIDAAFEPYAVEIGFLLREWNDLQEKLADLFTTLLGLRDGGPARAIWYAVPNDRLQRRILKDVASYLFKPTKPFRELNEQQRSDAKVWDEIEWIICKADRIGTTRDAAAHSPVAVVLGEPFEFISRHLHGNPLAAQLRGKKLLTEFRLHRGRTATVREHAAAIEWYVRNGRRSTFPERPAWPERPQKKRDEAATRRAPPK